MLSKVPARGVIGLALLSLTACKKEPPINPAPVAATAPLERVRCTPPVLEGQQVTTPITIDGVLDEPPWVQTKSSGAFLLEKEGTPSSPHTEVRALWNKEALILGLYAADQDLRTSEDAFIVQLETTGASLGLRVPVKGPMTSLDGVLPKGTRAAVTVDGTLDDPKDEDEEWAAEVYIPWSALRQEAPLTDLGLNVSRTDTPKGAPARTVTWACIGPNARGRLYLK